MTTFTLTSGALTFPHSPSWDEEVNYTRTYKNSLIASVNGEEGRASYNVKPMRSLSFVFYTVDYTQTKWLFEDIRLYYTSVWYVPLWPLRMALTGAVTGGVTTVHNVSATTGRDMALATHFVLYRKYSHYDTLAVSTYGATSITSVGAPTNSFTVYDYAFPVMRGVITEFIVLQVSKDKAKIRIGFTESFRGEEA